MKPFRSLLWTTVVLGVLLILYGILIPRQQRQQALEEERLKFISIDAAKLTAIHLESGYGKITLTHTDGGKNPTDSQDPAQALSGENQEWSLTDPLVAPAAKEEVAALLRQVSNLKAKRIIAEKAETLDTYGLSKPNATLTLESEHATQVIVFGKRSTVGQDYYVKRSDLEPVYLVEHTLFDKITQPKESFRNRSLWVFEPAQISLISIQRAKTSWSATREKDGSWSMNLDGKERKGDAAEFERLLIGLRDLRLDRFLADHITSKDVEDFGFMKPALKVTLVRNSPPGQATLLLSDRAHPKVEKEQIAVMLEGGRFIYSLGRYFVENLQANPAKYEAHGS